MLDPGWSSLLWVMLSGRFLSRLSCRLVIPGVLLCFPKCCSQLDKLLQFSWALTLTGLSSCSLLLSRGLWEGKLALSIPGCSLGTAFLPGKVLDVQLCGKGLPFLSLGAHQGSVLLPGSHEIPTKGENPWQSRRYSCCKPLGVPGFTGLLSIPPSAASSVQGDQSQPQSLAASCFSCALSCPCPSLQAEPAAAGGPRGHRCPVPPPAPLCRDKT